MDIDINLELQPVFGRRALAEALVRRWITDRGGLIDDPNYGTNLTDYINDDMSPEDLAMMQADAEAEAHKDERVLDISSTASISDTDELNIAFLIVDAEGPFTLTLSVSEVTVALLTVTQ